MNKYPKIPGEEEESFPVYPIFDWCFLLLVMSVIDFVVFALGGASQIRVELTCPMLLQAVCWTVIWPRKIQ
jgi:hypothetical protein